MAMIWKGTKTNYLMEIKSQKMLLDDKENWQRIRMIKLAYLCASPHGEFRLKPISLNPSFLMQSEVDIMQQCTMVWFDSGCFVNSHSYKKIGHQFILHQSCYKSN